MRHPSSTLSGQPGRSAWSPLQSRLQLARPELLSAGVLRGMAIMLSALGLALILISLQPYVSVSMVSEDGVSQGSPINQYGFLAAGLVFAVAMASLASRKALTSLLTPGFLLLGLLLAYSVATSPAYDQTLRAVILTVIGMFIAFSVIVLPARRARLPDRPYAGPAGRTCDVLWWPDRVSRPWPLMAMTPTNRSIPGSGAAISATRTSPDR